MCLSKHSISARARYRVSGCFYLCAVISEYLLLHSFAHLIRNYSSLLRGITKQYKRCIYGVIYLIVIMELVAYLFCVIKLHYLRSKLIFLEKV